MPMVVLDVAGTPADLGAVHGAFAPDTLRAFAAERVALAGTPEWSGARLDRSQVLALAQACLEVHRTYSPALTDELEALAEAGGIGVAEALVVGGFTDFVDTVYGTVGSAQGHTAAAPPEADQCTAFLVPAERSADGAAMLAQTWDMHAGAERHVLVLRGAPEDAPAFATFTTVGCLGMIGMNEHGLAVGINNLTGADGRIGVTWPFVVREVLRQRDLDAALRCIVDAPLAGAHNYLVLDAGGRGANVEATATHAHVTPLERDPVVHTNHCLVGETVRRERTRDAAAQASSQARLARAGALLARHDLTPEDLQLITADVEALCYRGGPPRYLATCGAVVMRPATRDLWVVPGLPSEAPFEHVELRA